MRRMLLLLVLLTSPAFAHPAVSVVIDSRGNVYYSDLKQVWRVAPDGKRTVAMPGVHTHELAIDAHDTLYGEHLWYEGERTDKWGHYVWKRTRDGAASYVIPRREGFVQNYGFPRDARGTMYWADRERNQIRRGNGVLASWKFRDVCWMTVTPGGTVYLVDLPDLVKITPDGRVTRLARGLARGRHDLMGLWTDGHENVYIADPAHHRVLKVTQSGKVNVLTKSKAPWIPTGGAIDRKGDLWLLEVAGTEHRVRRVPAVVPTAPARTSGPASTRRSTSRTP